MHGSYARAPVVSNSAWCCVSRYASPTRDIEVVRIFLIQHGSGNIRHISSCITFAGHENLEILDSKNLLEVEKESKAVNHVSTFLCFEDNKLQLQYPTSSQIS